MIAVVGLGYVGLPLALAFQRADHDVIGFDLDLLHVKNLNSGHSRIDDVDDEEVRKALLDGLRCSDDPVDLSNCNTFIICVPTPLTTEGKPDTRPIEVAVATIAPHIRRGSLVVLESTSYPGTTEELVANELAKITGLRAGIDFCVGFSPERVDPGNTAFRLRNTPKVVAGLFDCCATTVLYLYSSVCKELVEASGLREAELAKLLENTYRQVNIALVNELSKYCVELDIDLREAIRCAATKPFGFEAFWPGPGVGGHCIPIDPSYLAQRVQSELGQPFRMIELALESNRGMPQYVVPRLEQALQQPLDRLSIVLLGVAYKAGTSDVRESPAEEIVRQLRARGASVSYLDPYVPSWKVDGQEVSAFEPSIDVMADASILVTHHRDFATLDPSQFSALCLDTRGHLRGRSIIRL